MMRRKQRKKRKQKVETTSRWHYLPAFALQTETLMQVVDAAIAKYATSFPDGLAFVVMDMLDEKFIPSDVMTKVEQRAELNKIKKMGKNEDPDDLFEKLAKVTTRFEKSAPVSEEDKLAVILEKSHTEYSSVLSTTLKAKGTACTSEDLHEAMRELYRIRHVKKSGNDDSGDEDEGNRANLL